MQVWFYLLLVLHVVGGCIVKDDGQNKQITAKTGESVLLPCYCTDPHTTPERVTWSKYDINQWKEISSESDQYRNRVQLFNDHSPANLSLLISHLTEEDGGLYRCSVNRGGYRDMTLTVKGCTLTNSKKTLYITAQRGRSVLLPCSCTDLQLKPQTFTWNKYNQTSNNWNRIISKSDQYRNRVQLFNDHSPANLSLLISHLTEEDGGVYMCYYKREEYTDIRLTVEEAPANPTTPVFTVNQLSSSSTMEPKGTSTVKSSSPHDASKPKFLIYAAVVVLLLLMVLGGVIYWRYRVQRRRQMESCESKAEGRRDQEPQNDLQTLYATINDDGKNKKLEDVNDSEVLYATANTEDTKTQDMDDVTYSTVVHNKRSRPENKLMDDEDTTEYASIKLN